MPFQKLKIKLHVKHCLPLFLCTCGPFLLQGAPTTYRTRDPRAGSTTKTCAVG